MKSSYLFTPALMAALLFTACDSVSDTALQQTPTEEGNTVTFTLRTPTGDKVVYGRAIQDDAECAINSLAMYEYKVADDGTTALTRIMKKGGNGRNALNLVENSEGGYTFSIIVPAENDGLKFSYYFVANDPTVDPELGSEFTTGLAPVNAALQLKDDNATADFFAAEETGIAMTGVALDENGSDIITMSKGVSCKVAMTRIVSRVDIKYQTPNLKVTSVSLSGAPETGTLFAAEQLPTIDDATPFHTLGLNATATLPPTFLQDSEGYKLGDTYELPKAFYLYERANTAESHINVHIEYLVAANGREDYTGAVDVPFCKTDGSGEYIDAVRNHLYTIVLGNGTDPVSGKLKATINVLDWTGVDIDEPLTDDDDKIVENN